MTMAFIGETASTDAGRRKITTARTGSQREECVDRKAPARRGDPTRTLDGSDATTEGGEQPEHCGHVRNSGSSKSSYSNEWHGKRDCPEDERSLTVVASIHVDSPLISNLFISFLNIPRGDQKRFEILQLVAGVLKFTDEQREQAGLIRKVGGGLGALTPTTSGSRSPSMEQMRQEPKEVREPRLHCAGTGSRVQQILTCRHWHI